MSGHALAARTLLAAADELVGGPPVEASAAALAGDGRGRMADRGRRACASVGPRCGGVARRRGRFVRRDGRRGGGRRPG